MTDDLEQLDPAPAEAIPDFRALHVRQMRFNTYVVLNLASESPTAYTVDLGDLSCECGNYKYDGERRKVCKHLAKAIYKASPYKTVEEEGVRQLSDLLREVRQSAEALRATATAREADAEADRVQGASEAAANGQEPADVPPAERVENWLDSQGLPTDAFDVWVDEDYGSVQIDRTGYLEDDDYSAWMDLTDEEPIEWDGNNERSYIREDDLEEVLG